MSSRSRGGSSDSSYSSSSDSEEERRREEERREEKERAKRKAKKQRRKEEAAAAAAKAAAEAAALAAKAAAEAAGAMQWKIKDTINEYEGGDDDDDEEEEDASLVELRGRKGAAAAAETKDCTTWAAAELYLRAHFDIDPSNKKVGLRLKLMVGEAVVISGRAVDQSTLDNWWSQLEVLCPVENLHAPLPHAAAAGLLRLCAEQPRAWSRHGRSLLMVPCCASRPSPRCLRSAACTPSSSRARRP